VAWGSRVMLGRKDNGDEVEGASTSGAELVPMSEATAMQQAFGEMAPLHDADTSRRAAGEKTVAFAEETAKSLMLFLQEKINVLVVNAEKGNAPRQQVNYSSADIAGIIKRFPQFGLERVRCYAKAGAGIGVAMYDILVPTWNDSLMMDPAWTWGGNQKHWIGFRPADSNEVPVMPQGDLPVTSTQNLKRSSYHTLKPENFYWAKNDPRFRKDIVIDCMQALEFVESMEGMSEQLTEACLTHAERMEAVNERLVESRYKALGAGPRPDRTRGQDGVGL
jgi:hypothetical protein